VAFRARSRRRERYVLPVSSPSRPLTHLDKSEVLGGLFAAWDDIETLVDGLSEAQWQARTPLPGWCVHDVVAHLIGVESMLESVATLEADIDVSTLGGSSSTSTM
jgi:Mycothiol maleylpyruvate isomerase N-terminal domain